MYIIRVSSKDRSIIDDILLDHIDSSDKKETTPTAEHLQTLLNDNRSYLFAAMQDNVVLGYALVYRFPSLYSSEYLAYLYDIEVSAAHRRKGAGRLLIEKIVEQLKLDNVTELWLGTAVDNSEGQGLFTATGAIKSGETFNDYTYYLNGE